MRLKKGDIVGRISYDKDIIFVINNFIKIDNKEIAILKGLVTRIAADAPIDDLELIEEDRVIASIQKVDREIEDRSKALLIKKKYSPKKKILTLWKNITFRWRQKIQREISKIL